MSVVKVRSALIVCALALPALGAGVMAQGGRGALPPPAPPQTARQAAPIDFTGTWVGVVTEDWQWRFVTPIVGDYNGVPLNTVGDKVARTWNPDADVKAGEQCKGFGAAAINRLPTRIRVSWENDDTLKLEWDLGTQSRLVHFDKSKAPGAPSYQGHAIGEWIDLPAPGRGGGGGGGAARAGGPPAGGPPAAGRAGAGPAAAAGGRGGGRGAPAARAGGLKLVMTNLKAQYLRQNGVPISEKAVVTEFLDVVPAPDGSQWLIIRTQVDDPTYLSGWYQVSSQFKRESTPTWNPTPCELLPRLKNTATAVQRQGA